MTNATTTAATIKRANDRRATVRALAAEIAVVRRIQRANLTQLVRRIADLDHRLTKLENPHDEHIIRVLR